MYEAEPERDVTLRAEFKQKIRVPLRLFQELRDEMQCDPFMKERETACLLEIKLIASLRYFLAVGAGWGAVEDAVNVSRVTLQAWFEERFICWMKHKYGERVRYPKNVAELMELKIPYEQAGFPNCIGYADGVHVFY